MKIRLAALLFVLALMAGCGGGSSGSDDNNPAGDPDDTQTGQQGSRTINVVSWGGAYEFSQVEAYHKPWSASSGHRVESIDYSGGTAEIRAQVDSGNVSWDVVDMELPDASALCEQGLLEPIDAGLLPPAPDGTPAQSDFINGTLSPCGVGSIIWSTVIAYDTSAYDSSPSDINDFFDTTRFPGKRGVRNNPAEILEMALMADGVPPASVYSELASAAGIDQALAKLDQIKNDIIWWDSSAQSMQLLVNGDVTMTTTYNARVFNEAAVNGQPFGTLWDAQIWNMDLWVIPKGSPNKDLALDFIKFSTATDQLANQASYISYGPARQSSFSQVGNHYQLNIDMKPNLPTAPQNFQRALQHDHLFWANNQESLNARFAAWRSQ